MESGWRCVESGVSGQGREETYVLLCLDVSLTLGKLLAVTSRWKLWVM